MRRGHHARMETPIVVGAFALLLITISLLQPLARRLGLAPSVLLAMVGTLIGIAATYLLYTPQTDAFNEIANVFVNLPLDSEKILYIFLPILLFQTSLTLDFRRIMEDIGPILVMAVIAVLAATAFIGFALYPLAGFSLVTCLLLGAIVATTDPVAVVAIFRDIGAPARLGRIVEGESLLNDAAAIVIFVILLGILTGQAEPDALQAAVAFGRSFIGGLIVGVAVARLFVLLLPLLRDLPLAQVTLSLALPYAIYVVSDQFADVSAVVAVVAAGIVFNLYGPSRISPQHWTFLNNVWEQIAFWASSLIFVLASILIPRLVAGFSLLDVLLLAVVIVAALASRALVIFGLLPALSLFDPKREVSTKFKTVILWGGMRGAITLTLALSVAEHPGLPDDVSSFVTKLATGFVLFTLLVYGTSLKTLIRILGLDRLNARDQALRSQYLALALSDVRQGVTEAAQDYQIDPSVSAPIIENYGERAETALEAASKSKDLADKDRVILGLIALADKERQLVLNHFNEKTLSNRTVSMHLALAGRIGDQTRQAGRAGYNRAAREPLQFSWRFRIAQILQRRFKLDRPLATLLSDRLEFLLVCRIVSRELVAFNRSRIRPLVGPRVGDILHETLAARRGEILKAIEAIRLQYPDYADSQEELFLRRTGLRLEEASFADAHSSSLIGAELYNDLLRETSRVRHETMTRSELDLRMKTEELLSQHALFSELSEERRKDIARMMRPRFAIPGDRLIRKGDKGDKAFFIASGAVEVQTETNVLRLGRGDIFGEIALVTGQPRSADVIALGYCQLLMLSAADFRALMDRAPDLKEHVDQLSQKRIYMNAAPPQDMPPPGGNDGEKETSAAKTTEANQS
ncbi:sodium/hydrogen exchanger family protein [Roseibium sp. TrichSKD4]|uniref:cation:proton antiporter n=1 Tax=Roseibium sp. TrichSKD4 TaxID=744980 RepID=UPI0001E5714E|nr:cation:proton antiporter [Roseibium sp. TrichSKD4]EFO28954.1 sodium/hydrogen exchanger family protein [Roseibium sp. TrichSKD4]